MDTNEAGDKRFITAKQVAALFEVSPSTVLRWAKAGRLPTLVTPGGRLDSVSGRRILDLLEELRKERGLTVIVVTHDHDVATRADRIVEMLDGRIVTRRVHGAEARASTESGAL